MGASASVNVTDVGMELAMADGDSFTEAQVRAMVGEQGFSATTFARLKDDKGLVTRDQIGDELKLALDPNYTPEGAAAAAAHGGLDGDEKLRECCGKVPSSETPEQRVRTATSLIMSQGANPLAQDDMGWSPLMYSSADGLHEVLVFLLSKEVTEAAAVVAAASESGKSGLEAMLDAVDAVNCTALWNAARNGQRNACLLLLGKGADLSIRGTDGDYPACTAVQAARRNGNVGYVLLLLLLQL